MRPSLEVRRQMAADLRRWIDRHEAELSGDLAGLAAVEEDLAEHDQARRCVFALADAIGARREELAAMRRQLDALGL